MIKVNLYEDKNGLKGFLCKGHAGYAEFDEDDIICSAVTSLAGTLVTGLTDILDLEVEFKFESGHLYAEVENTEDKQAEVDLLMKTFEIGCKQIEYSYGSEYVTVLDRVEIK